MRKNLLANLAGADAKTLADASSRASYAGRGASRSMMLSIEEMAENAKRLVAGEAIVSLDPALLDASFVSDRVEDDEGEFALFREGIAKDGQLQPILVRPHPSVFGRYMVVFGHRRTRAARELGISVKAVVRDLEEIAHIVAQGQENSRRADLSFIEKALFARKLRQMGQSKETIRSALSVDETLLSRMMSVLETVPDVVVDALGAAKSIGRDRWEELKKLLAHPKAARRAVEIVGSDDFRQREGPHRFGYLVTALKRSPVRAKPRVVATKPESWAAADKRVTATFKGSNKAFSLSLASQDAGEFGRFLSSRLDELYQAFQDARSTPTGE